MYMTMSSATEGRRGRQQWYQSHVQRSNATGTVHCRNVSVGRTGPHEVRQLITRWAMQRCADWTRSGRHSTFPNAAAPVFDFLERFYTETEAQHLSTQVPEQDTPMNKHTQTASGRQALPGVHCARRSVSKGQSWTILQSCRQSTHYWRNHHGGME